MIARLLPANVRFAIYSVLSTLYGLELIFDLIDDGFQNKLASAAAFLGFSLAAVNTNR